MGQKVTEVRKRSKDQPAREEDAPSQGASETQAMTKAKWEQMKMYIYLYNNYKGNQLVCKPAIENEPAVCKAGYMGTPVVCGWAGAVFYDTTTFGR